MGIAGDVRKKEDAAAAVEAAVAQLGRLDVLVNAAAGNFLSPAEDLSPNGFRTGKQAAKQRAVPAGRVQDDSPPFRVPRCLTIASFACSAGIDSVGTFTMCHAALQYLKKGAPGKPATQGGVILNISANAALHRRVVPNPCLRSQGYYFHSLTQRQLPSLLPACLPLETSVTDALQVSRSLSHTLGGTGLQAAVDAITRSLALEWGSDYGICLFGSLCLCPHETEPA